MALLRRPVREAREPIDGLRYVTVVTYGRTGSTAIQAALNALPGVVVRGENYGALRGLRAYVQSVAETADRHRAGRPDHPWFGSARLDPAAVLADQRRHVVEYLLRPREGTRWAGFKEVRYEPGHFPGGYDELLDYLLFLGRLLPGLRYVMNVREAEAAARSGWWPGNDDAVSVLETTQTWLVDAVADLERLSGPGTAALVRYEEWSVDPASVIEALAGLGLPRDDAAVRAALATRLDHGPHAGDLPRVQQDEA